MADDQQKFIWSVKNGDEESVKQYVEKDDAIVCARVNGRCPIHFAADYGQKKVIDVLLSSGAKINEPDKFGITPLLSAIYEGHKDCVKFLLEKGADKTGKSPDGKTYEQCAETSEIKALLKA